MTSSSNFKAEYLAYAFHCIAAKSDEDRFSASMNHAKSGMRNLASFGIFDGHMGATCAEECSTQLHDTMAMNYKNLLKTTNQKLNEFHLNISQQTDTEKDQGPETPATTKSKDWMLKDNVNKALLDGKKERKAIPNCHEGISYLTLLRSSEIRDAIACESIRRAHETLDEEIKKHSNSGATSTSLYLLWEGEESEENIIKKHEVESENNICGSSSSISGGETKSACAAGQKSRPVRVFCSNLGDSRCVMLRSYDAASAFGQPSRHMDLQLRSSTGIKSLSLHNNGSSLSQDISAHSYIENYDLQRPQFPCPVSGISRSAGSSPMIKQSKFLQLSPLGKQATTTSACAAKRFTALHLMSEDHKLSLSRERSRITKHLDVEWHYLPADASAIFLPLYARTAPPTPAILTVEYQKSPNPSSHSSDFDGHDRYNENISLFVPNAVLPLSLPKSRCIVQTSAIIQPPTTAAELHNFGLISPSTSPSSTAVILPERPLLPKPKQNRRSLGSIGFHAKNHNDAKSTSLHGILESSSSHDLECSTGPSGYIFDWAYPPQDVEIAARTFIKKISKITPNATCAKIIDDYGQINRTAKVQDSQEKEKDLEMKSLTESLKDSCFEPPQVYGKSFIQTRNSKDGSVIGPEALYGRHNISILMTRSMGDRFGPRSCISLPEISSYTIPVETHVRFVLASDGFWDVVSAESVRNMGLTEQARDAKNFASALAQKAYRRRERARMRMDDISVLVVDVNPNNYIDVENILSDLLFSRGRHSFSFIEVKYDRNRFKKHDELDVIQTVS